MNIIRTVSSLLGIQSGAQVRRRGPVNSGTYTVGPGNCSYYHPNKDGSICFQPKPSDYRYPLEGESRSDFFTVERLDER